MESKDAIVQFRTTQGKKNSFHQKYAEKERSKILRWLLDGVLSNKIVVPKEILQD